jgi:hypothetical protein
MLLWLGLLTEGRLLRDLRETMEHLQATDWATPSCKLLFSERTVSIFLLSSD